MDKSWKQLERKTAKALGTTRTPLSGGNSKHTRSDTLDEKLFIECKLRANFSVMALYQKTLELARKESKIPILVLKEKGKHGELAVIDFKWFIDLYRG